LYGIEKDGAGVSVHFSDGPEATSRTTMRGRAAIACDGSTPRSASSFIRTKVSRAIPASHVRGVTPLETMLSGASWYGGWLSHGKMVIYPIRHAEADGPQAHQLGRGNRDPGASQRDWTRPGSIDDFTVPSPTGTSTGWMFPPSSAPPTAAGFPMVDQDPLPRWSLCLITLLGRRRASDGAARLQRAGRRSSTRRALTTALLK